MNLLVLTVLSTILFLKHQLQLKVLNFVTVFNFYVLQKQYTPNTYTLPDDQNVWLLIWGFDNWFKSNRTNNTNHFALQDKQNEYSFNGCLTGGFKI